ncbi:transposase [Kibdelosporangium philippinense]|uniref:Transposase n=1 Tax=Kibdelosporangium philippinense TaxID=211113 RepID=A0ABS8Z4G2_9PSEU|nr:transposase [Kibdelosporangium philippinense]
MLCTDGPIRSLVGLSLAPEHRRGHGALYDAVNCGRIDIARLRNLVAAQRLPRAADDRIVLAVDVTPWLRPDANTSPERSFCHTYGRGKDQHHMVPGWPYSIVAALETGRAFATLAAMGAVEDSGDFPPFCTVKPGELLGRSRPNELELALIEQVLSSPTRAKLDITQLDNQAAAAIPDYRELAENPAVTWQTLADLHDRGLLDVSAAPSRRLVTGLRVIQSTLPRGFHKEVTGKVARAAEEIRLLWDFFQDTTVCANRKFADYFGVGELPDECCSNAGNRCSACWNDPTWPPRESRPTVADAFETSHPKSAGSPVDSTLHRRRLDDQVHRMIWDVRAGLHPTDLYNALRGEDSYYLAKSRRRVTLRRALVNSRYFGANPAVRIEDVHDSVARLADKNLVVQVGKVWRNVMYVQQEQGGTGRQ